MNFVWIVLPETEGKKQTPSDLCVQCDTQSWNRSADLDGHVSDKSIVSLSDSNFKDSLSLSPKDLI